MKRRIIKRKTTGEIVTEAKMMIEFIKINIASAAELRFSFLVQVGGMMINNLSFVIIWWFFSKTFGTINGWTSKDIIALQAFSAATYGFTFAFFSGAAELPNSISTGAFDSILLTPKNLYLRIFTLVTQTSALGDLFYGFILLALYIVIANLSIIQSFLLILLLIPAVLILANFLLISSCLAFFIPDSIELSKNAFEMMFGPSLYPSGVYQGIIRFILLFILPAIAVGGLPVEAVKELNLIKVAIICLLAVVWTCIAIVVLNQGLKRYESGNLTGARI